MKQFAASERRTVAVAAVGDLGRYIIEALHASPDFNVIAISRQASVGKLQNQLADLGTTVSSVTAYTDIDELVSVLNATKATALISTLNFDNDQYYDIHLAFLRACHSSQHTTRFIPSEWGGNIEQFPHLPPFYALTRQPFRELLRREEPVHKRMQGSSAGATKMVEWTLFGCGWLMDYFLPGEATYVRPAREECPVDLHSFSAVIPGTGDEAQSWTLASDVARAIVEMLRAPWGTWEETTYVAGEWSTFNAAIDVLEAFYGRKMGVEYKEVTVGPEQSQIDDEAAFNGHLDEWIVVGGTAVPREKGLRQREKYFKAVKFLSLQEALSLAQRKGLNTV